MNIFRDLEDSHPGNVHLLIRPVRPGRAGHVGGVQGGTGVGGSAAAVDVM